MGDIVSSSDTADAAATEEPEARRGTVRNTASKRSGEECKILIHDASDPALAWKVVFEDGHEDWFKDDEIEEVDYEQALTDAAQKRAAIDAETLPDKQEAKVKTEAQMEAARVTPARKPGKLDLQLFANKLQLSYEAISQPSQANTYAIGERVEVRDFDNDDWKQRTVTRVKPLSVGGLTWKYVRKIDEASQAHHKADEKAARVTPTSEEKNSGKLNLQFIANKLQLSYQAQQSRPGSANVCSEQEPIAIGADVLNQEPPARESKNSQALLFLKRYLNCVAVEDDNDETMARRSCFVQRRTNA